MYFFMYLFFNGGYQSEVYNFFFFPGKALLEPLLQQGELRTNNMFPARLLPKVEVSFFLTCSKGRSVCPGVWLEG